MLHHELTLRGRKGRLSACSWGRPSFYGKNSLCCSAIHRRRCTNSHICTSMFAYAHQRLSTQSDVWSCIHTHKNQRGGWKRYPKLIPSTGLFQSGKSLLSEVQYDRFINFEWNAWDQHSSSQQIHTHTHTHTHTHEHIQMKPGHCASHLRPRAKLIAHWHVPKRPHTNSPQVLMFVLACLFANTFIGSFQMSPCWLCETNEPKLKAVSWSLWCQRGRRPILKVCVVLPRHDSQRPAQRH